MKSTNLVDFKSKKKKENKKKKYEKDLFIDDTTRIK